MNYNNNKYHQLIYSHTTIFYQFINNDNIDNIFVNYLSLNEIQKIDKFFQNELLIIHMVETEINFQNKKSGTLALKYFFTLFPNATIILFCENHYIKFNLIDWYKSLSFNELYSNLECTLLIKK